MSTPDKSTKSRSAIGSPHIFPKSEDAWKTEFFQKHAGSALQRRLDDVRDSFLTRLYNSISHTESPLEAAFIATLMALEEMEYFSLTWRSQCAVEVEGRGYRLDFVVEPMPYGELDSLSGPQCPKVAIELDGHDFHEKTKEQVTARNRRDRDLQSAGWTVMHVSGSEFNSDPERVTREVYRRVSSLFWAAYRNTRSA
jgi:hypothetical protein